MAFWGNIFTHYRYTTTDIQMKKSSESLLVTSRNSSLNIEVRIGGDEIPLPLQSPFKDWKEARRFAGPLPFTFTYNKVKKEVLIIEGIREGWTPKPVEVIKEEVGFVKNLGLKNAVLANAFLIENIPYYWKKGKRDTWKL